MNTGFSQHARMARMPRFLRMALVVALLLALLGIAGVYAPTAPYNTVAAAPEAIEQPAAVPGLNKGWESQLAEAIIIDHSSTDITEVPQAWIEEAKRELHIAYGHTSHGGQVTNGMLKLVDFANNGGLGLNLPQDIFAYEHGGTDGALDLREPFDGDAGYYPQWVDETRDYLGPADPATGRGTDHATINVVMWAWCGQVSDLSEQEMLDEYLLPMSELEEDYPGITFVYMTGHADGTGEEGNLHLRNQQIRDYCIENGKVLYDFYDIELYDPDGNYYGDKAVNDNCDYDSDGNGSRDRNWAIDWQDSHTEDVDWYSCTCTHSQPLNCNQKAYAAWWLWARLAGWGEAPSSPSLAPSYKIAYPRAGEVGDQITYSVIIRSTAGQLSNTVWLTDTIPEGLAYVPGTLTSTAGVVSEDTAPTLYWSGVLSPTPVVTVTYAATIDTNEPQAIANNAILVSSGYQPLIRTVTILANPHKGYLPIVFTDR